MPWAPASARSEPVGGCGDEQLGKLAAGSRFVAKAPVEVGLGRLVTRLEAKADVAVDLRRVGRRRLRETGPARAARAIAPPPVRAHGGRQPHRWRSRPPRRRRSACSERGGRGGDLELLTQRRDEVSASDDGCHPGQLGERAADRRSRRSTRPMLRWNSASATWVLSPKIPSTPPGSNPSPLSRAGRSATSSPCSIGLRRYRSRSPRRKPASTRLDQVCSPQTPSVRRPRWDWNACTAGSRAGPVDAAAVVARASSPSRPSRSWRSATASPASPSRSGSRSSGVQRRLAHGS